MIIEPKIDIPETMSLASLKIGGTFYTQYDNLTIYLKLNDETALQDLYGEDTYEIECFNCVNDHTVYFRPDQRIIPVRTKLVVIGE